MDFPTIATKAGPGAFTDLRKLNYALMTGRITKGLVIKSALWEKVWWGKWTWIVLGVGALVFVGWWLSAVSK
jgi:hypothetical protein